MNEKLKTAIIKNLQALKYMGFKYIDLDPSIIKDEQKSSFELPQELEQLENIVKNCHLCNFSKNNKEILFLQGDKNSKILFLNLYSNDNDPKNQNIFTGNSAIMLSKICKNVLEIDYKNICVINILKCIPSKSIEHCQNEINICKPYIYKQLDIIKPKLIVAFGDSYNYLVPSDKTIAQLRENIQDYNGIKIVTTYHPLHILRNPSCKKDVFDDFKKVKSILERV
jgi:DNA polymerase